jgi:hypothetical protein
MLMGDKGGATVLGRGSTLTKDPGEAQGVQCGGVRLSVGREKREAD